MRNRRLLVGIAAVVLLALAALPAAANAAAGLAPSIPALASPAQKPFIAPEPRPDELRGRPTDGRDPNRNSYSVPEAPKSPFCGPHFCVHWVAEGLDAPSLKDSDGNGIPDYVQTVLRVAEHVHLVENEQLGWREPKSDGRRGGGVGKTDIYLSQIGPQLFGYAAPDRGQGSKGHPSPRHLYGYLVLDNDYSPFEFPGTKPINDLKVTLAHEYDHILQFGYDAYQDPWFAESTAVWMEDQVYNDLNDYLRYERHWVKLYDTPLTASSIKEYGSAVWNEWLAKHYGRSLIRKAWAGAIHARPGGFAVASYERAIRTAGPSTFSHDFSRFAAAVAEWHTNEGFRESYLYPEVPRRGSLPLGGKHLTRRLNHTTFQFLRVPAQQGRAVVAQLAAPRGDAAALALVGRIGSERHGHTVTRLDYSKRGGVLTARLSDPGRFERITAVVVNADAQVHGYSARRLDWRYLTEGAPFTVGGWVVR
ncbi:MAG: hypothetical protein JST31_04785 [Actinobacteria bacterium]|nr:hypothetical protein [Actinomycetota bacterium]